MNATQLNSLSIIIIGLAIIVQALGVILPLHPPSWWPFLWWP
jgi:hypothetical protein